MDNTVKDSLKKEQLKGLNFQHYGMNLTVNTCLKTISVFARSVNKIAAETSPNILCQCFA